MSRKQRNKDTKNQDSFLIDKIIWTILTPILKPLSYLNEQFFPEYEIDERLLRNNEPCYCGSKKEYSACHQPELKKKGKIAIKITKTYKKTRRTKVKYKVKPNEKKILRQLRSGSVNPLNTDGKYVGTDGYQSL
ncbi:SEC-C domain-containing protein [Fulvivirga sp. 29W222]|uniref:SEC-C domain-containing protein n=1 Tax=Fulvivirga marina TaxID=2494733 RepID=A0A937FTZ6_9BACT|nr:SEC-C metal-binding domain-containing protein [Fulvivirga marina]MBL6445990.1 SEC-C domain-containing protein [Fulvivirga marina]